MDGVAEDHLAQIAASFTIHPDFPIKGVSFRNILPVMRDPQLFGWLIDACVAKIKDKFPAPIDLIVGLEARGFLFGPAIALRLNCGFVAIRKPGKLPGKLATVTFKKEYGEDVFEIEEDAIKPGQRVVIVDDVLATGGTLRAATQLMEQRKALPVGTFVIVELLGLGVGVGSVYAYVDIKAVDGLWILSSGRDRCSEGTSDASRILESSQFQR